MPGPVIEGHAEIEEDCKKCHQRFRKAEQKSLCLDCHEKIAEDVQREVGFHGRAAEVSRGDCRICHSEHLGRDADIVQLDSETFEHAKTDFPLEGRHRSILCERCHAAEKKHREAPSDCIECHGDDEPHRGRLGRDCAKCHSPEDWKRTRFDHDDTKFPLVGKHESVKCEGCHTSERYERTPSDCQTCHLLDDAHAGAFGKECSNCHSPRGWDVLAFDHDKDTQFPLLGSHRSVDCSRCHPGSRLAEAAKKSGKGESFGEMLDKPDKACITCHRVNDEHKGRFGGLCDKCHIPKAWDAVRFEHNIDTEFPLRFVHTKLRCAACHAGVIGKEKMDERCVTCHESDDAHDGQEGDNCEQCHNEEGWRREVRFDHDLAAFPLLGLHAIVSCEECHPSTVFRGAPSECVECHREDDTHKRRLGTVCELCHNPNGWGLWRFDHNTQTDFVLDGAHEGLACHACHTTPSEGQVEIARTCGACHARDDAHFGSFGRRCGRCHTTSSFKEGIRTDARGLP